MEMDLLPLVMSLPDFVPSVPAPRPPVVAPGDDIRGCTEARLFTPPLRELTRETSYGYAVIDFARNILKTPLDPWEEWLVIHMGELLEDGTPRFRKVLVIVARQNGKTYLCRVLTLFWMFISDE